MAQSLIGRRLTPLIAVLVALALLTALLPAPGTRAADHLDAPGLTPPSGRIQADINDLYVFTGANPNNTVMAMTVHPLAAPDSSFADDVTYAFRVDTDGDAEDDHAFTFTFSSVRPNGAQFVIAQHNGALIGFGQVGKILSLNNGGWLFTGLRSDPFFFDLAGFLGTVEGVDNGRALNDGNENDFFAELDTLAIVMEVPDTVIDLAEGSFGGGLYGTAVGVWANTTAADGSQIDRKGRPAINTAVNSSGPIVGADPNAKNVFNQGHPRDDAADFTEAAAAALIAFSSLDSEGAYTECQLGVLATVFLPDILPFSKDSGLPAPVVGRALADDVIDTSLRVVTGGDPLGLFGPGAPFCADGPARDADGAINTDGVGPHDDYQASFPYLGEPHADITVPVLAGDTFMARLSGTNEVPPVVTNASGVSTFRAAGSQVNHLNVVHRLNGVTMGHIHLGDPGENGPVVAFLYGPSAPRNVNGILSMGRLGEADLVAGTVGDLLDVMRGGFAYVNHHTTTHPGGELRGQIGPLDVRSGRFVDTDGTVHRVNIDHIAAAGITRGCNPPENSAFCPDRNITRGEMAAFLNRGFSLGMGTVGRFTDTATTIFRGDIEAIAEVGITRGCNPPANDRFCPDRSLTRGEMAALLNRAFALPAATQDFFVDDDGSIFEEDINRLAAAGITRGCNPPANDRFCPDRLITRAEMASFLARAFGWGG